MEIILSVFDFVKASISKKASMWTVSFICLCLRTCDVRLGKIYLQEDFTWIESLKSAKRIEAECEFKRSGSERTLKIKEGNHRILDWISLSRSEDDRLRIQSELKLDDEYISQCQ